VAQNVPAPGADPRHKRFYRIGGVAAWLQLAMLVVIIVVTATLGLKPTTAQEYFSLYQDARLEGLLRDDFASLLVVGLYLGTFPGLYLALRRVDEVAVVFATLFTLIAVTITFTAHSGFSMIYLGEQYAAATTAAERAQLLAAGEAVIASDMWNSSGGYVGGLLLQGAGVLISAVMLRSRDFGKTTAYAGLLANAFDLTQHLLHPVVPSLSTILGLIAGLAYLFWFPLLGRDLSKLARRAE